MNRLFQHIAEQTAFLVGTPWAFIGAVIVIIAWGVPVHYSAGRIRGNSSSTPAPRSSLS